ncbi:hypothetical protein [Parasitella parasitica]|uniref:MTOR-associated protein MEAK7 n=1 Tax=Parasitella parasitica TaxID=35722 RepID=A0A0B7MQF7_9FUNG|nr:hypothetical protein [Parasitella parasitica]
MGSAQSQDKPRESQLWSHWSPEEKEQLKRVYDKGNVSSALPAYIEQDLIASIIATLLQPEKNMLHFLATAHSLIKTKEASSIYTVFDKCVKSQQASLQDFVTVIVKSAIPLWWQDGSSYQWKHSSEQDHIPLVNYFINYARTEENKKRESMAWLAEDNAQHQNKEENHGDGWQDKALLAPSQISEAEFSLWIENTPGLRKLFQLVVEHVLIGKQTRNLHSRRLQHLASPQIQQHGKETRKLLGKDSFSSLLKPYDYFMLSLSLPANALSWSEYEQTQRKVNHDVQHEMIFSSKRDGSSWQVFVSKLVGQGATLVVVKAKDGTIFGGYADDNWEFCNTNWYGNSSNFLFRTRNTYGRWEASSGTNDHYQYLCWGKKSLPNGFGMGGQFDYAGLWIDADFIHGHSRAGPLCTTYSSPQLSNDNTFVIDQVEVWLVRPLVKDDQDHEGSSGGVLSHAEDMEFMEMAGKKMYSKDLGPEPTDNNDDNDSSSE